MNAFKSIEQEHGNTKVKSDEQIDQMKHSHASEIRVIQEEFDEQKKRLIDQLESLSNENNELEI